MNLKRLGTIITFIIVITLIAVALWHSFVKTEDIITKKFTTMGTYLTISAHPKNKRSKEAINKAYREARRLNNKYSTHNEDSLISRLKKSAPDSVTVDDEFLFLFQKAKNFWQKTGGKFDVTVGPLVELWGFYRKENRVPSPPEIKKAQKKVGMDKIRVLDGQVQLPNNQMRLDFGAFVKGYAVDRMAEILRKNGINNFLIDLGGNIYAGGKTPGNRKWEVGLRDPRQTEKINGVIKISDRAVATSGDYEQMFVHNGKRYSHIIDPREGKPIRNRAAVTAVAPSGLKADLFSTSLFLTGPAEYASSKNLTGFLIATLKNNKMDYKISPGFKNILKSTRGNLKNYQILK